MQEEGRSEPAPYGSALAILWECMSRYGGCEGPLALPVSLPRGMPPVPAGRALAGALIQRLARPGYLLPNLFDSAPLPFVFLKLPLVDMKGKGSVSPSVFPRF